MITGIELMIDKFPESFFLKITEMVISRFLIRFLVDSRKSAWLIMLEILSRFVENGTKLNQIMYFAYLEIYRYPRWLN